MNDHVGNILIGYIAYYEGLSLEGILVWVNRATILDDFTLSGDDTGDQEVIHKGYKMAMSDNTSW